MPRRVANGLDHSRLLQVLAVLERRAGLSFGQSDVYVSVAGGVKVTEPAADLPLALALASALKDRPMDARAASFGEVGLTGELRSVGRAEARLGELSRMGFATAIAPAGGRRLPDGIAVRESADLRGALDAALRD
jgi:DNA repair protein RadA/Sms